MHRVGGNWFYNQGIGGEVGADRSEATHYRLSFVTSSLCGLGKRRGKRYFSFEYFLLLLST